MWSFILSQQFSKKPFFDFIYNLLIFEVQPKEIKSKPYGSIEQLMLYPTVLKQEIPDVALRYDRLHKASKNNVIDLYDK